MDAVAFKHLTLRPRTQVTVTFYLNQSDTVRIQSCVTANILRKLISREFSNYKLEDRLETLKLWRAQIDTIRGSSLCVGISEGLGVCPRFERLPRIPH